MKRVGLLGDTHGSASVVIHALERFHAQGIKDILQVGDFGFWPGKPGQIFLTLVNSVLAKTGQNIYVTPGNHEDYTFLRYLHVGEDGWAVAKSHIFVAPRGHRWTWEGVSFVSLGGAPSVDRQWRRREMRRQGYPLWWPEEDITTEDMMKVTEGGYADVMVAHDAPLGVPTIEKNIAGNPNGFAQEDLEYADAGRQKMLQVVDIVRPQVFFHGHYHFIVKDKLELFNENSGMDDVVRIFGFSADGAPGFQGTLNLEDLSVSHWQ